ncbi:hypothetical protein BJX70DRAFT_387028 [Aspergillus crustosus]
MLLTQYVHPLAALGSVVPVAEPPLVHRLSAPLLLLYSLNLSCREFHDIVSPFLHKTLRIRFPGRGRNTQVSKQDNKHERLHELLGPDNVVNIHQYVRFLTLSGHIGHTADSHGASLLGLVESLPNLEVIRWRGIAFPPHLFQIIKAKQQPPLFYYEGRPLPLVEDDVLLGALFIKSLNITYPNPKSPSNISNDVLGTVIISLPNLERLVLKYNPRAQILNGVDCPPKPIFDLPPASSITLPPLRVLCLANLAFSPEQAVAWARSLAQRQTLRHLDLDGVADMTVLIDHHSDCPRAGSSLLSLSVRLHDATRAENVSRVTSSLDKISRQINALSAFSGHDLPKEVLHAVIAQQRTTLRQLRWRHTWYPLRDKYSANLQCSNPIGVRRSREEGDLACIFSPGELQDLAEKLPHVERLGVDLWFWQNTNLLNMPPLERTRILLPTRPSVDKSIAIDAFQYVIAEKNFYGKKASAEVSQSRLIQLAIKVGEWEPYPWDANTFEKRYIPFAITVCMLRVEFKSQWHRTFLEENKFEQAMDLAGCVGVGKTGGWILD